MFKLGRFTVRLAAIAGAGALTASLGVLPAVAADDDSTASAPGTSVTLLGGKDRYETSIFISRQAFPQTAPTAYIARGDVLADALSAGSLTDGPILLAPNNGMCADTLRAELARLRPAKVVALGGQKAISDATLKAIAEGRPTDRIAGASRFETSANIALRAFPNGAGVVYVADGMGKNGQGSPDAVAGGSLTDGPVVLVSRGSGATAANVVRRLGATQVIALGGPGVVSDAILSEAAAGQNMYRLAGSNRYLTALEIAKRSFPSTAANAYIARADVFADAVAAGTLTDGPILLAPITGGPEANYAAGWVREKKPGNVHFLGLGWPTDTIAAIQSGTGTDAGKTPQNPSKFAAKPLDIKGTGTPTSRESAVASKIASLINSHRAEHGAAALQRNADLDKAARRWSEKQVELGRTNHSQSVPTLDYKRVLANRCQASFEFIGGGQDYTVDNGASGFFDMWKNSAKDDAELVSNMYQSMGIAIAERGSKGYATVLLCDKNL